MAAELEAARWPIRQPQFRVGKRRLGRLNVSKTACEVRQRCSSLLALLKKLNLLRDPACKHLCDMIDAGLIDRS